MTLALRLVILRPLKRKVAWTGITLLTPIGEFDIRLDGKIRLEKFFGIGAGFVILDHAFGLFLEFDPELDERGHPEGDDS